LCRTYHSVGFCPYGPRCHFVHNLDEAVAQQQARPAPAPATPTVNKQPIGSGRREDQQQQQQQKFKPLPMFDNSKTSWNPLNSTLFNNVESEQQHHQQQQLHQLQGSARLPVFSTLSE
jgi:tristetraprolin